MNPELSGAQTDLEPRVNGHVLRDASLELLPPKPSEEIQPVTPVTGHEVEDSARGPEDSNYIRPQIERP